MAKFVGEHLFSQVEKRSHLRDLVDALEQLLACPDVQAQYPQAMANTTECLQHGRCLLDKGFTQGHLSELARRFEPMIKTHPRWEPPLAEMPDGTRREPEWYSRLERLHDRVAEAAQRLCELGEVRYSDG